MNIKDLLYFSEYDVVVFRHMANLLHINYFGEKEDYASLMNFLDEYISSCTEHIYDYKGTEVHLRNNLNNGNLTKEISVMCAELLDKWVHISPSSMIYQTDIPDSILRKFKLVLDKCFEYEEMDEYIIINRVKNMNALKQLKLDYLIELMKEL